MARMIPESPIQNDSKGEEQAFEAMKSLPDDYTVFHSVDYKSEDESNWYEEDFIVFHQKYGLLCIQVKSTKYIECDEKGQWYFGESKKPGKSPFKHAEKSGIELKKKIKNLYSKNEECLATPAVWFTSISKEKWESNEHRPRECYVLTEQSLSKEMIQKEIESAYKFFKYDTETNLSDTSVTAIIDCITKRVKCVPPLSAVISDNDKEFDVMTKEETKQFDSVEDGDRILTVGPAGTGKTFFAIKAAKRFAENGNRVALFCHQKNLEHLLIKEVSLPNSCYVGSVSAYLEKIGVTSEYKFKGLKSAFLKQQKTVSMKEEEKFDVIVVDDAQDLLWDNDYDVFDIILKGGLKDGLWRFFADFKQSGNPEITFEKTKKTFKDKGVYYTPYSLKKNCRNTKSICDKIALVTGFKLDWEAKVGNHPDFDPKFIPYSDAEEQQEKLEEIIKQLLENKKIPQKNIAVLSYRNTDNEYKTNEKPVISRLLEKDIYKGMFKEYREQKEAAITYGTVHGFKGLENDVIILTDVNLRAFKNKEWMYLAMSRARTKLYILLDDKAHEEYEKL